MISREFAYTKFGVEKLLERMKNPNICAFKKISGKKILWAINPILAVFQKAGVLAPENAFPAYRMKIGICLYFSHNYFICFQTLNS